MKTISIIIPVYNAEKFLCKTIESVLAQTFQDWELILIDDASTDDSRKVAEYFTKIDSRIRLIPFRTNFGVATARNAGIKAARGRFVCFLDADDLWNPEKLERQLAFMREKNCAFSFTNYEFADENGKSTGKTVTVPARITYRAALKNTTIWTSTVMFDLAKLPKAKILMPNIKSEDTATWWKVLKETDAFGLNQVLSTYRRHGKSLSSNKLEAIRRIWRLYRTSERLPLLTSTYNLVFWALNATKRRI